MHSSRPNNPSNPFAANPFDDPNNSENDSESDESSGGGNEIPKQIEETLEEKMNRRRNRMNQLEQEAEAIAKEHSGKEPGQWGATPDFNLEINQIKAWVKLLQIHLVAGARGDSFILKNYIERAQQNFQQAVAEWKEQATKFRDLDGPERLKLSLKACKLAIEGCNMASNGALQLNTREASEKWEKWEYYFKLESSVLDKRVLYLAPVPKKPKKQ